MLTVLSMDAVSTDTGLFQAHTHAEGALGHACEVGLVKAVCGWPFVRGETCFDSYFDKCYMPEFQFN